MLQAAIFDVDGTLVDSVDLHARAWQDALADFGHEITFERIREQIGKGGDQLLPVFLSKEAIARSGDTLEAHRGDLFKQRYLAQIRPFPKVRDLIARLQQDGLKIALASSAKADELQEYKKIANIADLIDEETTSDDARRSKPHPDIFAAALSRLGNIPKHDIIVFGDTPYDAQAAAKAGLRAIGLLCGGWSEADLRGAGCHTVYRDPEALLDAYAAGALAGDRA